MALSPSEDGSGVLTRARGGFNTLNAVFIRCIS